MDETPPAGPVHPDPASPVEAPRKARRGWLIRVNNPAVPRPAAPAAARPVRRPNTVWAVLAVVAVGVGVLGIIAVGFRGSMGALRDAASAAHIEAQAAALIWIGVDGLIVVAIIAALVLRHDRAARRYCLSVVGGFTFSSWLLNYLHGLGRFTPASPGGQVPSPAPWVVFVIASLIIGTIFFGTHLLVYVLRHLFPGTASDQPEDPAAAPSGQGQGDQAGAAPNRLSEGVSRSEEDEREERKKWCAVAYGLFLDKDVKISNAALAKAFQISPRQVGYVRTDVDEERRERAEREAAQARAAEDLAHAAEAVRELAAHGVNDGPAPVSLNGRQPPTPSPVS